MQMNSAPNMVARLSEIVMNFDNKAACVCGNTDFNSAAFQLKVRFPVSFSKRNLQENSENSNLLTVASSRNRKRKI